MHYDGILLRFIKIRWLNHPSIELNSFRSGKRKELFAYLTILRYLGNQLRIIQHLTYLFALIIIDSIDIRMIMIAPCIQEELIIARERSRIPSPFFRQNSSLPSLINHINLSLHWLKSSCLEISIPRLLIITIYCRDIIIALINLSE